MPPVGFKPTISVGERPQTYALDCAATGTGNFEEYLLQFSSKFLSFYLVSRNIKTKVYKTTISPAILYCCKTGSSLLTQEHRPRECNERVPNKNILA